MDVYRLFRKILAAAGIGMLAQQWFLSAEAAVDRADSLVVEKDRRLLHLYSRGSVVRTCRIQLGRNPIGPKRRQGDGRTPEGRYVIAGRNHASVYHRALMLSYPNTRDFELAGKEGVNPGGNITIHGWPNSSVWNKISPPAGDYTRGCIGVTNAEIEELWRLVPIGTPVIIYP